MPARTTARPFFRPESAKLRYLPESPRMIGGKLFWVSIQYSEEEATGGLNVLDLATRENVHHPLPGRPGFVAPAAGDPDEVVLGLERQLVRFHVPTARIAATLAELPDDPRVVINDGLAIPGAVLFGTKELTFKEPLAALYRFEYASGELRQLLGGQTCSNGKYLHGDRLIDIDSTPRTITEYRYGAVLERLRLIVPPASLPAIPDGMRPMPDGESVVVAFVNPDDAATGVAQALRLADGAVLAEWSFPGAPRVTCPEFVTVEGAPRILFTTAVEGIAKEQRHLAPEAGSLFLADIP
jgi:sugar lactone lactonase YvrE